MKAHLHKTVIYLLAPVFILLMSSSVYANALTVSGVSYDLTAQTVTFTLGWQNSWRTTTTPHNWDAAWVFVKFRECGVDPSTPWTHGLMNTDVAQHSFSAAYEPTLADGSAPGIETAPNNTGVMLRRSAVGRYVNAAPTQVTLKLTNLAGTTLDIKVFGIEMVFIPESAYFVGDGTNPSGDGNFTLTQVTSEAPFSIRMGSGYTDGVNNPVTTGLTVPANFPKGFAAFYMMKYEITQGQYADFLNTIPATAEANRYPGAQANRYSLNNAGTAPNMYAATRPDRAMNWISWADFSAYLDWSALRPMTDFEFEKACRGPLPPVQNEHAWGTATAVEALTISTTVPNENGTEVILDPNANVNYISNNFTGGDANSGPLRVGIFAQSSTNSRVSTGATYYGVMEMSGNVWEYVVPLSLENAVTNPHQKRWGDGDIASDGNHNVTPEWPAFNVGIVAQNPRVSIRGGGWGSTTGIRVCNRYYAVQGGYIVRDASVGGRGVR